MSSQDLLELIRPMACRLSVADSKLSIREVVTEILSCAQSFVPCEAGSLMLSHPEEDGALVFVASFGAGAEKLPGTKLPPGKGISGQVFRSGEPFLTNSPDKDSHFYSGIDRLTEHHTGSLLCVPLLAFGQPVGVLSLLNREGGKFEQQDLDLMKIFCRYLSQSIHLMLEARRQQEAALRDHLTGLYNDRYLYQYLTKAIGQALKAQQDVGLIFLDLDHFKSVVDSHGHLVGSQALRECGILIGEVARKFDAIPARYGGDEYVLVLSKCCSDDLGHLAEAVRLRIEEAVLICENEGDSQVTLDRRVTASIGVACLSQLEKSNRTVESLRQHLLRLADTAMYRAKALGKNCIYWATDKD